jgi:hypothetical protein
MAVVMQSRPAGAAESPLARSGRPADAIHDDTMPRAATPGM